MTYKTEIEMNNILLPLIWSPNKNDNVNDLEDSKSPIHDYILEADGDRFIVRYHNRITGESDRNPVFDTIEEAKAWVQNIHAENKIGDWVKLPTKGSLERCIEWFHIANPEPALANVVVQQGVHCEEIAEMFDVLGEHEAARVVRVVAASYKAASLEAMDTMAGILNSEELTDEWVDSMVDQLVTTTGTMANATVSVIKILDRVNVANFSKFVDGKPVRETENGKIQKGPGYEEPNLCDYIDISGKKLLEELATYKK